MKIYEIEIELNEIKPRVWRKFILEGMATLDMLHLTIQGAMGWRNCHIYEFNINGQVYGDDVNRMPTVSEVLQKDTMFTYIYDFGDNWVHRVKVTELRERTRYDAYHKCIAGEKACPPEDCGGVFGYYDLIKILSNKSHPEYKLNRKWAGGFNPDVFSVTQASAMISALLALR